MVAGTTRVAVVSAGGHEYDQVWLSAPPRVAAASAVSRDYRQVGYRHRTMRMSAQIAGWFTSVLSGTM